jgi:CRP/FNR family cyclic AMP-dependent transcriptional regulator
MQSIHLIDADPELAGNLPAERVPAARRELVARQERLARGPGDVDAVAALAAGGIGLLLLDGLVERDVMVSDTVSAELLGPGDVIRSAARDEDPRLLGVTVAWDVLADTRFAVLDARSTRILLRYPEVAAILLDRLSGRAHRLATAQAICQLNGVDRRLIALFWHLAERWGRVSSAGIVIPLDLPHRVLAQLVGARRPTVSTAMRRLDERGELQRRPDGAWLMRHDSAARWAPPSPRAVAARRLRLVEPDDALDAGPVPAAGPTGGSHRLETLRPALAEARATAEERVATLREIYADSLELRRRHVEMRERCRHSRRQILERRAASAAAD